MTDNQKIAYEWAKSHDYPSIAARYARELAGLVDDLQEAYDDMAGDLELRTKQVRQLQGEISALRQQDHFRDLTKMVEPLTLDDLRKLDGEPVWVVYGEDECMWALVEVCEESIFLTNNLGGRTEYADDVELEDDGLTVYRQNPEEGTV